LQSGIFGTSHFYALGSSVAAELTAAESTDASDRKAWLIVAYIMAACTAILILLTLLMLRRVKVCIQAHILVPLSYSHSHPAHLAHAVLGQGMHPSSRYVPFFLQPSFIVGAISGLPVVMKCNCVHVHEMWSSPVTKLFQHPQAACCP